MKASFSQQNAPRTQTLMGKSNRLSKIPSLPKTKKKQDRKQDYRTDSDLERCPVFTEIWPSEPFSPSDTPTSDKNGPQSSRFKSREEDTEHNSVLARYVDRFRHGHPQSREERQQNSEDEQLPFWWASSPSLPPNLAPKKTDQRLPRHNRSISPSRGSPSVLSESSLCEPYDSEILQLQERASRLLQQGEFSLEEDSLPVSSDGIGCSDFSSPVSADEPVRKPMISSLPKYNIAKDLPSVMPSSVTPLHQEEDILFQWRLRRKMEKAREWSQSQQHFNPCIWQGYDKSQPLHSEHRIIGSQTIYPPDLPQGTTRQSISGPHFTTLDQQTTVTTTTTGTMPVVPSGSVVSSPQALAHVPSHMHLLCDILPCPNRPHEDETVSQKLDSQILVPPQKPQHLPSEPPITGHVEKDVHLSHNKSTKEPKKQTENTEKKVPLFSKAQKKSARVHSRQKMATTITSSTLQHQHKHTDSNKKSRRDGAPPPSPIKSALGQVVSEVLFPSMDSTIVQHGSPSSPCHVSEPQQSNYYESVKVISQYLQEAEDSDEKEFEDDPLLQVLRKQRKWVKEQINEVDTLLKEFEAQHKM